MNASRYMPISALLMGIAVSQAALGDTSGQERAEAAGKDLVGSPAPRLTLKTIDGAKIDLGALYGKKAVYLKFWATWCVPCRQQMPHFEHTYEQAGPDLAVIAVNAGFDDTVDEVRTYQHALGITMPIVVDDGQLAAAFHLRVTPQHIVIRRDGRIAYVGHLADARLDAALAAARQATPPSTDPVTAPALPQIRTVRLGERLPEQSLKTVDGKSLPLQPLAGTHPTVLVFLSPWCESYLATTRPALSASCKHAREQVNALTRQPGIRWIGIASGLWTSQDDLRQYRQHYKVGIPLVLDESGTLFRTFGVTDVPTVLIADARGTLVRRWLPDNPLSLSKAIQSP